MTFLAHAATAATFTCIVVIIVLVVAIIGVPIICTNSARNQLHYDYLDSHNDPYSALLLLSSELQTQIQPECFYMYLSTYLCTYLRTRPFTYFPPFVSICLMYLPTCTYLCNMLSIPSIIDIHPIRNYAAQSSPPPVIAITISSFAE